MSWITSLPLILQNLLNLGSPGLVYKPTDNTYELKPFSDDEANAIDKSNTVWSQRAIEAYINSLMSPDVGLGLGLPNPILSSDLVPENYQAIWYRSLTIGPDATLTIYGEAVIL